MTNTHWCQVLGFKGLAQLCHMWVAVHAAYNLTTGSPHLWPLHQMILSRYLPKVPSEMIKRHGGNVTNDNEDQHFISTVKSVAQSWLYSPGGNSLLLFFEFLSTNIFMEGIDACQTREFCMNHSERSFFRGWSLLGGLCSQVSLYNCALQQSNLSELSNIGNVWQILNLKSMKRSQLESVPSVHSLARNGFSSISATHKRTFLNLRHIWHCCHISLNKCAGYGGTK